MTASATRNLASVLLAALAGSFGVSILVTIVAITDGEGAQVSLDGAAQWFGVSLFIGFPVVLIVGTLIGLPAYIIARRRTDLTLSTLCLLGGIVGGVTALAVSVATTPHIIYAISGTIAGASAAFSWWFTMERYLPPHISPSVGQE